MKKILLYVCLAATLAVAAPKPKLVVAIVVDQFRYDYLTRFRSEYHAGFDRLLTRGAVFTNARYVHFPTVTAIGHATVLSGATPSVSGIVGNDWFDRQENVHVTSVSDPKSKLLGGTGEGASPRRLLVSTVGDELKMANPKSHVVSVSLKDRAAILPAGHMADGAYWFDVKTGNFVSSTYYFADLPGWVKDFNAARPAEKYRGTTWLTHKLPTDLIALYGDTSRSPLEASPYGNELVELFAERALTAEQLGSHATPDILCVSFSSNDKVGHDYGTYSPEEHDVTVQTDRILARLFDAIDRLVGLDNVLFVLTSDHGVAPSAEEAAANRMPGGRLPGPSVRDAIQAALVKQYGPGDWIAGSWDLSIYLNWRFIASKNLNLAEVTRLAAAAAFDVPHVSRVYTRDQLLNGALSVDAFAQRIVNGFNMRRGADLVFIPDPYWIFANAVSTHGSPFGYDTHVPVIFMGAGIKPGNHDGNITVNDIAPTLAAILQIETPSGSVGRVLTEMLQ